MKKGRLLVEPFDAQPGAMTIIVEGQR